MGLLKIAAAGAIGYFAYRTWQRRASAAPAIDTSTSERFDRPLVTHVPDHAQRPSHDAATSTPGTVAH